MKNTNRMTIKNKIYLFLPIGFFIVALLCYQFFVINITPSMKKGIYLKLNIIKNIRKGDIVLFCLSEKYQQAGLTHHYLEKGKLCNGTDPLIKEVIAVPGDQVTLLTDAIVVNGLRLAYKTRHHDSRQLPLVTYPRGQYTVDAFWVIEVWPRSWRKVIKCPA
jgi:conjugative transfer signal peptidase TraF